MTILPLGTFAWIAFLDAAQRLRRPRIYRLVAIYAAITIVVFLAVGLTPTDDTGAPVGVMGSLLRTATAVVGLAATVVGCIQLTPLRREAYTLAGGQPNAEVLVATDPAVAKVLMARARRAEAREIILRDRFMAHELGIGRPDLGRGYYDGGLIDLNSAPAGVIATGCGMPESAAQLIVQAREARGGIFAEVTEALILAEIPVQYWDQIRDRAVLIP